MCSIMQDCVYYAMYVHVSVQNTETALKLDQTIYMYTGVKGINLVKLVSNILRTHFLTIRTERSVLVDFLIHVYVL